MADDRFREQAKKFTDMVYSKPSGGRGRARGMSREQWTNAIAELIQAAYEGGWTAGERNAKRSTDDIKPEEKDLLLAAKEVCSEMGYVDGTIVTLRGHQDDANKALRKMIDCGAAVVDGHYVRDLRRG